MSELYKYFVVGGITYQMFYISPCHAIQLSVQFLDAGITSCIITIGLKTSAKQQCKFHMAQTELLYALHTQYTLVYCACAYTSLAALTYMPESEVSCFLTGFTPEVTSL